MKNTATADLKVADFGLSAILPKDRALYALPPEPERLASRSEHLP